MTNNVCLEQQIYTSQENLTQLLVAMFVTPYIPPLVIIQTFSLSKGFTSSISFLVGQY